MNIPLDAGRPPLISLIARLAKRGIHVAARNGAIRVSPHVYTGEADIDRFLGALAELA